MQAHIGTREHRVFRTARTWNHFFGRRSSLTGDETRHEANRVLPMAVAGENGDMELSAREREVMGLVAKGLLNKEIARELHVSPHTVNDHLKSIYPKLGVSTRAGATSAWLSRTVANQGEPAAAGGTFRWFGDVARHNYVTLAGVLLVAAFAVVVLATESGPKATPPRRGGSDGIEEYLARVEIPGEQRAALEDGYVTHAEHETAIQKTIACASAAGVRMQPAQGEGLRPTRLGVVRKIG